MTNFQTPQTWLSHNAMGYRDLNVLPHVLLHALPYIFYEICLILAYLQCVTFNVLKKIMYIFFYKFDGNVW